MFSGRLLVHDTIKISLIPAKMGIQVKSEQSIV